MDLNKLKDRQSRIRNFSIVAHIDHGKSSLADQLLSKSETVADRDMEDRLLDSMDLERERGITIKLNAVELTYTAKDGQEYILHLIDTPGHVDFTYEVSRSLAACEGALLVVDAVQGIEAQTLANVYLALDNDLEVLPVINKIDLPAADPDRVALEVEEVIGLDTSNVVYASARDGIGIEDILEQIVEDVPAPTGDLEAPLKALIFDSTYDSYQGVIVSIRVKDGIVKIGDTIRFMNSGAEFEVTEVGVFNPDPSSREYLMAGDVGYLIANIRNIQDARVGDTITLADNPAAEALPGYRQMNPMVFAGLYPVDSDDYNRLRDALEKLQLNDASLVFEAETSQALGFGFRTGFLGLLHMDVIQERLEREYNIDLIITAPSVIYEVLKTNGEEIRVDNPSQMPLAEEINEVYEPFVRATVMVPNDYVGPVMELNEKKRGTFQTMDYIDANRVNVVYELPLSEIVYDYFDTLKSRTRGYASLDYEIIGYQPSDLVKLDVLLNGEVVDALSLIVHRDFAYNRGRDLVDRLRELIPQQLFEVPIQAAIGNRIVARTNIRALRKDVTAHLYGGDVTRRMKLLEAQKEGKKRMKQVGSVEVPQEAFMAILEVGDD